MRPTQKSMLLLALALGLSLTAIYWPALTGQFVNHDDPLYITENPVILQGMSWASLKWALTSITVGHWHPVTWLSHLAGIELFGVDPFGHHLINLLLHFFNALLLAFLLQRLSGNIWRSCLVAALFAVHPLNVEPVAWVAERKGVLSGFFWLLAVISYVRYSRGTGLVRYVIVIFFFVLSLASKAVAVTLPCALLLLDYWPLNRCRLLAAAGTDAETATVHRLLAEKVPFLLLSILSGVAAVHAMWQGISSYSLLLRVQNVILGYAGYVVNVLYPAGLSVYYPFVTAPSALTTIASLAALLGITGVAVLNIKNMPYLFTGWFWYLVTLAPVMGFINLGQQTRPDRYSYIPVIGLFIVVVWGTGDLLDRLRIPVPVKAVAICAVFATLSLLANRQAACWHDSRSLFSHAVEVTPFSSLAHNNLGIALLEKEGVKPAFGEFVQAVRLDPGNDDAWNNLGVMYGRLGRNDDAITAYLQAKALNPGHALARLNLGMAYVGLNDMPKALREYRTLQELKPEFAEQMKPYLR